MTIDQESQDNIYIGDNATINGDVFTGGKHLHLHQTLLAGLTRLATDYSSRFQRFLEEYLGTPNSLVPFGGRQAELDALDAWLTHPEAPPYALLVAEAGRGKSALLAHWTQSLLNHDLAQVIFIPISIRFNTALASVTFPALAARLGEVYQDPVKAVELSADQWREVCLSYMRRSVPSDKPLLVILDGLDEAADWQAGPDLFPLSPPPGVRIIVSARYLAGDTNEQGWLRRLGWNPPARSHCILLPLLTIDGVRDVLHEMGDPLAQLASKVDVVAELFRLSQGDPLLVRLYAEALLPYADRAASLQPEDLPTIKSDLTGYFERWWEDQQRQWEIQGRNPLTEKADVLDFFNLCATALGPLTRDEVVKIAGGNLTSGLRLKNIASEVGRFIIGDGQSQGYVFNHSRLSQFFWEQMTAQEQRKWEAQFLDFGRRTVVSLNTGTLTSREASPYAVQYYGAHLERGNAPLSDLDALTTPFWHRAWEGLTGTASGFLNDVDRAWRHAEAIYIPAGSSYEGQTIGQQSHYALITASLHSLAANLPPDLLPALVTEGKWTPVQALAHARQSPDAKHRAQALTNLIPCLPPSLQPEALPAALEAVGAIEEDTWRADALTELATYLSEPLVLEALTLVDKLWWPSRTGVLVGLVSRIAALGKPEQALATARGIEWNYARSRVLAALIPPLSEPERTQALQEALTIAKTIERAGDRVETLAILLPYLSEPERSQNCREAVVDAGKLEYPTGQVQLVANLVTYLPEPERSPALHTALDTARTIEKTEDRLRSLITLIPYLAEKERLPILQEVMDAAQRMHDFQHWAELLSALFPYLPPNLIQQALTITHAIENPYHRTQSLAVFIPYLTNSECDQTLKVALAGLQAINDAQYLVETLKAMVPHLTAPWLQEALAIARGIEWGEKRAEALTVLAPYLSELERSQVLDEALIAAQMIQDDWHQVQALAMFAPYLTKDLLQQVLTIAYSIRREAWKVQALAFLAKYLPEPERSQTLEKALADALTVNDTTHWPEIMAAFAPQLPQNLLLKAIAIAQRGIGDRSVMVRVVAPLAFYLSEPERTNVFRHALFSAWSLGAGAETLRVQSLVFLLPYLPDPLIPEARAITRKLPIQGDAFGQTQSPRLEVLARLIPRLTEPEQTQALREALTTTLAIEKNEYSAYMLVHLIHHLPESERAEVIRETLAIARTIEPSWRQVGIIAPLTDYLPNAERTPLLEEALAAIETARYGSECADALTALAPYLPHSLLLKGLTLARRIKREEDREKALVALARYLPEPEQTKVIKEALAATWEVEQELSRVRILDTLLPLLSALPLRTLTACWQETLRHSAKRTRRDLLADLEVLEPITVKLGGIEAAVETAEAVLRVGTWWP